MQGIDGPRYRHRPVETLRRHRRAERSRVHRPCRRGPRTARRERRRQEHLHPDTVRRDPPRRRLHHGRRPRVSPRQPRRGARTRHRRRVPGAVADPRPDRRGEHLVSPRADDALADDRPRVDAAPDAGTARPLHLPAATPRPRAAPPHARRTADRRDRQGAGQEPAHPDPRRGDIRAPRPRGRLAA